MNVFLDSSAIVKIFHVENGSDIVMGIFDDEDVSSWACDLVRLEFSSAIMRRFRLGEIHKDQLQKAQRSFDDQWEKIHSITVDKAVLSEAENLLRAYGNRHNLRSLDAIHAAAYTLVCADEAVFITSDTDLEITVTHMGYVSYNPMTQTLNEFYSIGSAR